MKFDQTILDLSDDESDEKIYWTLQDAFQGVQIFGGIGSGKTSGSGNTLASAFLKKNFGGLVLCAKPDECDRWKKLAKKAGRSEDVIVFSEKAEGEEEFFFNPLDYEARRKDDGKGGGETFNLVNLFMQIYQMGKVISGEGLASGGERFWDNALKRCISRMIDLLQMSGEKVTISNMYRVLTDSLPPKHLEHLQELRGKNSTGSEDAFDTIERWAKDNYYVKCDFFSQINFNKIENSALVTSETIKDQKWKIHVTRNYFEKEFTNLAEKTKTIIVESFLGLAEPFQSGILKKYFSGKTNITPEMIFEQGKIIILDFPIKNYLDSGIYAQGVFKLLFQQAVERRTYKENRDIPVFLWVDESQNFLNAYDQVFQTTARSAGVSTVFITQNISNYYVAIGGSSSTARVNSLLGNLSTKIFHNNNDYVTNEWASKLIGKAWKNIESYNVGQSQSFGLSKQFHWKVEPTEFAYLKTGGKKGKDGDLVECVFVASRELSSSGQRNYIHRSFKQMAKS